MMRKTVAVAIVVLVFGFECCQSTASQLVVPNALETTPANQANASPFLAAGGQRYQQVYDASQFSSFGGPRVITEIAFRCSVSSCYTSPFSFTFDPVEIHLSTTAAQPDGLSTTFANNVGTDTTLVHSGALTLSGAGTSGGPGVNPFDIVIPLQTGFLYDPSAGNLLLDIKNSHPQNIGFIFFDVEQTVGDSVSRIVSNQGQSNAATGFADTRGIVTQFTSVPEPTALVLFSAGLPLLFGKRRR